MKSNIIYLLFLTLLFSSSYLENNTINIFHEVSGDNSFMDFDNDGVDDSADFDDDNDGILDTLEQNGDVNRDTDNDGSPDHQDLDSDNDGCFDVIEAGFTDDDNDGMLGDSPETVGPDGTVINVSDGYTQPLDSDGNTVLDFQEGGLLNSGSNGVLSICITSSPVDLFDSLNGTPDAGGTWSPVLTSGTGIFDPNVDVSGTYTYTVINAGVCGSSSAQVIVDVNQEPDSGIDGLLSICESSSPVDLFDSLGGIPQTGGTWTPTLASGTGIFDPSVDAQGTYTYMVRSGACGSASSQVEVTVDNEPDTGTSGSLIVCTSTASVNLLDGLGGTPNIDGTWSPPLTSGTGIFDPNADPPGTYTYTSANGACGSVSSEVMVTVVSLPDAGSDGALSICDDSPPIDIFNSLGGTPDSNGVWSPRLSSGTGVFDPISDLAGTYTYTVDNGTCGATSAQVIVSIDNESNPGENGRLSICSNATPVNLFDSLGGTPDLGGTWSPVLSSGTGVFDPLVDPSGIYTYTIDNGACGTIGAQVVVDVFNNSVIQSFTIETTDFEENNSITITINQVGEYEYSLDNINFQSSNIFSNLVGGDYRVYVREISGCGILEQNVSILDYPSFFTPNNDGVNDCWNLKGLSNKEYSISIFNRFGKLIKKLENPNQCWNGTFNGKLLPSSDYWFQISFKNGKKVQGNFALIRK